MATVNTVLGPRETSQLGFTLMHEHIISRSLGVRENWPELFDREAILARAVEQLREAEASGVGTIVDLTTVDLGRDVRFVQDTARQVGLNVIVATGIWRDVPRYFQVRSPDVAAGVFVRDITEGIQGTDIKAAIIKNASDDTSMTPAQQVAFRASARAHRQTGIPISTHTNSHNQAGLDQQRVFLDEGVDLTRVVIGHSGDTLNFDYLQTLLDRGSTIGMDRFGLDQFGPMKMLTTPERVGVIAELCRRGYANQMVLSHDASCYLDWRDPNAGPHTWPNWRMTHIPLDVVPALRQAGVSEAQIERMTVSNPRAFFERQGAY